MWLTRHMGRERCVVAFGKVPTKQRPRHRKGQRGDYTPKPTRDAEKAVKKAWKEQVGERWANFAGEVRMLVLIERPLAKSNPKWWAGRADLMSPDCDNTGKLCGDSLNGVAYVDDRQITNLHVIKLPRVPFRRQCRVRIRCDYYEETHRKDRG